MTVSGYPPPFANDDPLRRQLAFNAEYWRIQELIKVDPVQGEAELQRLLDQVKAEKAAP